MEEKTSCITINCGCCGNGNNGTKPTPGAGDGTPVGTVIAYMSTKVPEHYLACDGAEYRIDDYPLLSHHILDGFGMANYFGGDGTVTFAVPDLRNEFLRGYHGDAEAQLSGDVGKHQEATELPMIYGYRNSQAATLSIYFPDNGKTNPVLNQDSSRKSTAMRIYKDINLLPLSSAPLPEDPYAYSTRPFNVAVLYCIKYE